MTSAMTRSGFHSWARRRPSWPVAAPITLVAGVSEQPDSNTLQQGDVGDEKDTCVPFSLAHSNITPYVLQAHHITWATGAQETCRICFPSFESQLQPVIKVGQPHLRLPSISRQA